MATVEKRGESYRITVSCGYDINGKQIRKTKTYTPAHGMTQKQIEKQLEREKVKFEEQCQSGQILDSSIRFAEFADKWMKEYAELQLRPKTVAVYKTFIPRINAAIGNIKLDKLRPHHLSAFYENLCEPGIREDTKYKCSIDLMALLSEKKLTKTAFSQNAGISIATIDSIIKGKNVSSLSAQKIAEALGRDKGLIFTPVDDNKTLSTKTVLHYHRLISSILSVAVQWQVIFSNPCERVKPPRLEKQEPRYLDEQETGKLLELIETEDMRYKTAVKLLLYTGFRRGELMGLEWKDIDWNNRVITVRRSSMYLPKRGIFEDETKNKTSCRSIKVPSIAFDMLRDYQIYQTEQRLQMGDKWHNTDRLFTKWDGTPMHPDSLTSWFHDFISRSGLPDISIHSLRHTNATLQIAGGVDIATVANRLGHANSTTTGRIYIHAIQSADQAAADTLENLLNPLNKSKTG